MKGNVVPIGALGPLHGLSAKVQSFVQALPLVIQTEIGDCEGVLLFWINNSS